VLWLPVKSYRCLIVGSASQVFQGEDFDVADRSPPPASSFVRHWIDANLTDSTGFFAA